MIACTSLSTKLSTGLEFAGPLGWIMLARLSDESAVCRALTSRDTIPDAAGMELVWDISLDAASVSAGMSTPVLDGLTRLALVAREMEEDLAAERFLGGITYSSRYPQKQNFVKFVVKSALW